MSAEQWKVFFDKLSTPFYKQFVFNGLLITLKIAILGFVLGVILGTVLALVQVAYNKNVFVKILDKICKVGFFYVGKNFNWIYNLIKINYLNL